jgi:hypothetical protein
MHGKPRMRFAPERAGGQLLPRPTGTKPSDISYRQLSAKNTFWRVLGIRRLAERGRFELGHR